MDTYGLFLDFFQFAGWCVLWLLIHILRVINYTCYSSKKNAPLATVLVVGGGFAGSRIAAGLENEFRVILVDDKSYMEFTPSVPRALVQPERSHKIIVQHKTYLRGSHSQIIHGKVVRLDPVAKLAYLQDGTCLSYDYAAICTGSGYAAPFKNDNQLVIQTTRENVLATSHARLCKASSVLIVGGGSTGVEVAAEIAMTFPAIQITLVGRAKRLIKSAPVSASEKALQFLKQHGVRVLLNDSVDMFKRSARRCSISNILDDHCNALKNPNNSNKAPEASDPLSSRSSAHVTTVGGQELDSELLIVCGGILRPNSNLFRASGLHHTLDSNGYVLVNECLQLTTASYLNVQSQASQGLDHDCPNLNEDVKHFKRIFVVGDVSTTSGERTAQAAQARARVCVTNIKRLHTGLKPKPYQTKVMPMVISLGPRDGIFTFGGWCVTGFIPAVLKEVIEWKTMAAYWYKTPLPF